MQTMMTATTASGTRNGTSNDFSSSNLPFIPSITRSMTAIATHVRIMGTVLLLFNNLSFLKSVTSFSFTLRPICSDDSSDSSFRSLATSSLTETSSYIFPKYKDPFFSVFLFAFRIDFLTLTTSYSGRRSGNSSLSAEVTLRSQRTTPRFASKFLGSYFKMALYFSLAASKDSFLSKDPACSITSSPWKSSTSNAVPQNGHSKNS